MSSDPTFNRLSPSPKTRELETDRRTEFIQSSEQVIQILSAHIIDESDVNSSLMPLWIEVLRGLFKAWHKSLKNNTPEGEVHSPENTVFLLEPWIKRLLKMNILSKSKNLESIEKLFPGSKRVCAEALNDFSVALSELKPVRFENLQRASDCISISRSILDREIYLNNQKLIKNQIRHLNKGL